MGTSIAFNMTAGGGPQQQQLFRAGASGTTQYQPWVRPVQGTSFTDGQPSASTTAGTLLSANEARIALYLTPRDTTGYLWLRFDATTVTSTNWHIRIPATAELVVVTEMAPNQIGWLAQSAGGALHYLAILNGDG